jgi:Holliday junction DNA helicase RuvA
MIALIQGELYDLNPAYATIFTSGGIAYQARVSLETYNELLGTWNAPSSHSKLVQVFTEQVFRTDQPPVMVAFSRDVERKLFKNLTKIHGVGLNNALSIISGLGVDGLLEVANNPTDAGFKCVKGIGNAIAKQLVLDAEKITFGLADTDIEYLQKPGLKRFSQPETVSSELSTQTEKDAIAGLTVLGMSVTNAKKAVAAVLKVNPNATVQELIKQSLQQK